MQPAGNIDYFMAVRFGPGKRPSEQPAIGNSFEEVTNWLFRNEEWQMWFRCTSNINQSYSAAAGGTCR